MEKPDAGPSEQDEQQFTDLLQQLRVVQTGVQILSALLLTLPFTSPRAPRSARRGRSHSVAL